VRGADRRVLLLLWLLADRWGRVTPRGVTLPLRLTHSTIAHLVCMGRPTVSATLGRLTREGEVRRRPDGTWLLTGSPPDVADAAARAAERTLRAA
jgi:CRP-like cAMP-binding protein